MSAPIVVPLIQSGVYRISSTARCFPELYLERQRDTSIKAVQLNHPSDAQKWMITPDEDGAYKITCVQDGSIFSPSTSSPESPSGLQNIWSIEPRGHTFIIGNAFDSRALSLGTDNCVRTSDRNNIREQRWILHLFSSDNVPTRAHGNHGITADLLVRALRTGSSISDSLVQAPPDYSIITSDSDNESHSSIRATSRNAIVPNPRSRTITNTNTHIPLSPSQWGTTTPLESRTVPNGFYHILNVKTTSEMAVWKGWQAAECPVTAYAPCANHHTWDQARGFAVFQGEDGGFVLTNTYSTGNAPRYVALGPQAIPTKNVCRLFPVRGQRGVYMISTDMETRPPNVICDANTNASTSGQNLTMARMRSGDQAQMWRFVEI